MSKQSEIDRVHGALDKIHYRPSNGMLAEMLVTEHDIGTKDRYEIAWGDYPIIKDRYERKPSKKHQKSVKTVN